MMADELWNTLMRFHREVALPDIRAEIAVPLREEMAAFRRETNGHFDALYKRLDRLESEYEASTPPFDESKNASLRSSNNSIAWRFDLSFWS